jgi:hypothetical protein
MPGMDDEDEPLVEQLLMIASEMAARIRVMCLFMMVCIRG